MKILSLNHTGDTLKTTIQTKQDLYTNSYKITINWGTIQVLENVFYTKVSRIRRLTVSHKEWRSIYGHAGCPTHLMTVKPHLEFPLLVMHCC